MNLDELVSLPAAPAAATLDRPVAATGPGHMLASRGLPDHALWFALVSAEAPDNQPRRCVRCRQVAHC